MADPRTSHTASLRGFASLSPERRSEIARMGAKAQTAKGTRYQFSHDEQVRGGSVGGTAVASRFGHMRAIGKLGGASRWDGAALRNLAQAPMLIAAKTSSARRTISAELAHRLSRSGLVTIEALGDDQQAKITERGLERASAV